MRATLISAMQNFDLGHWASPSDIRLSALLVRICANLGSESGLGVPLEPPLINSIIYAAHSGSTLVVGTCSTWTKPNIGTWIRFGMGMGMGMGESLFIFLAAS